MNLSRYLDQKAKKINRALTAYLPSSQGRFERLHEAMRYSVLSDGKRVRPILLLESCCLCGGNEHDAMPAACAVELIHNYSLVHDDLPAMDDDDSRRGRPTCHKKYDEATAILVGDALLSLSFEILMSPPSSSRKISAASAIAQAIGVHGMVGGQALDMDFKEQAVDLPTLEFIHTHKSGALIAASIKAGALIGKGSVRQVDTLFKFGKYIGFLFQIVDDILDNEGYVQLMGLEASRDRAREVTVEAKKCLESFGKKATILSGITDFILTRSR